ncbi:MAG: sigma-70 family RNA polymerase sigma factor, partial [Candidatus Omnitrophica bacterium]|nr:sigma-70 family RNA polymerase sigma factor [Candidatus Omnitrophota bacterium]
EEADDLCHEIFLRLADNDFEKLKTFKASNGCKLATWLRHVTVNYVISHLRKARPLQSLDEEFADGANLHDFLQSNIKSARENLTESELFAELKDCIGRLEADELRLIELAYYRQATIKELEMIFRLKRSVLDMRKTRATAKLRECMQKKGFFC